MIGAVEEYVLQNTFPLLGSALSARGPVMSWVGGCLFLVTGGDSCRRPC